MNRLHMRPPQALCRRGRISPYFHTHPPPQGNRTSNRRLGHRPRPKTGPSVGADGGHVGVQHLRAFPLDFTRPIGPKQKPVEVSRGGDDVEQLAARTGPLSAAQAMSNKDSRG